jgi:hypothetical protein
MCVRIGNVLTNVTAVCLEVQIHTVWENSHRTVVLMCLVNGHWCGLFNCSSQALLLS